MGEGGFIRVRGARVHNLRGVDVDLPRGRFVVLSGPSGSGKSSLAFDTIYAEAQRRFVDALALDVRAALEVFARPDVDSIEGLPPALAVPQRPPPRGPRSTVATMTEVHDFLRLLYARVGEPSCPRCGAALVVHTTPEIVDAALAYPEGTRLAILAPIPRGDAGALAPRLEALRKAGYVRVRIDGVQRDLGEEPALSGGAPHDVEVFVDRLVAQPSSRGRLADSVTAALRLSGGVVKLESAEGALAWFTDRAVCLRCGGSLPELEPRLFSFNGPHGACATCSGTGVARDVDPARIIPDDERSLLDGAVAPWGDHPPASAQSLCAALGARFAFDLATPWREIPAPARDAILLGTAALGAEPAAAPTRGRGKKAPKLEPHPGVVAELRARLQGGDEGDLAWAFTSEQPCAACRGKRLRPEALAVRIGGRDLAELCALSMAEARAALASLALPPRAKEIAARLLRELDSRLGFLIGAGLGYVSLDRSAGTLSSGEAQRMRLGTQLGGALVGVLYVLDEPTSGLHARDAEGILRTLCELRDAGNTLLVVEHDLAFARAADLLVDVGPGAGAEGGRIVAAGTPSEVAAVAASPTGRALAGHELIPLPRQRRVGHGALVLHDARGHNLAGVTARIPLGALTCVTGVSGSGKSSLVVDTLVPALRRRLGLQSPEPLAHGGLSGAEELARLVEIDSSPIGRTPRSNPATYSGLFGVLRELFAELPEAKVRGYGAGRFSFNQKGGRCEACLGDGVLRVSMTFLPDVFVRCERCGGRRYDRETLEVRYRGLSIADVLDLSVDAAFDLFAPVPRLRERLSAMRDVGLGYLPLGQGGDTLSGGEAQRLKLARELARRSDLPTLYVLDEPTAGLHAVDVRRLLEVLSRLVAAGHTVLVVEHDLDVAKVADWVIDLGPDGGPGGGQLVAMGTPEAIAACDASVTAPYLRLRLRDD